MKKVLKYSFLIIITIIFLFPIVYMLACSFMGKAQISTLLDFSNGTYKNLDLIPDRFSLNQYYQVFFRRPEYLLKFWNSIIMTVPTVIGQVIISSLAAFAFAKLKFPFRDKLFFIYIILLILPLQVTIVPDYIILDNLGLLNNFLAVILPGTFSAFGICLLRQSMKYISDSSIEAARIDGASRARIFLELTIPLSKPIIIYTALVAFMAPWCDFVMASYIAFGHDKSYNVAVALQRWVWTNDYQGYFTRFCAGGILVAIPVTVLFMFLQKYYVEGVTGGAVKG